MPDFPVYDHAAADRGRREMLQLFSNGFQKDEYHHSFDVECQQWLHSQW